MSEINKAYKTYLMQDLLAGGLSIALVNPSVYTYSSAHSTLANLPANPFLGSITALQNVTVNNAVLDADDVTIANVPNPSTDPQAPALITEALLIKNTGTASTSRIVAAFTGLSINANGSGITIRWSDLTGKILSL